MGTMQDSVGLSNELSCEARSFSRCCSSHRFLQPEVLKLYFSVLEPWVVLSIASQLFLLAYPPVNTGLPGSPATDSGSLFSLLAIGPLPTPWLLDSTPPTSLGECFFFNSLVVGLPYSLIFWQFWLFWSLNWCCPPFGCLRKQSICIYGSSGRSW